MQDEKKLLTQRQVLAEKLKSLAGDVTKADRLAFLEKHEFSPSTLSLYLKGKVHDNDTAVTIITFFQDRIEERYKAVAK